MLTKRLPVFLLVATTSIGIAACATGENSSDNIYENKYEARNELICRRQRTVGSHIPVQICRTRAQIEADREAAMRMVGPLSTESGNLPPPPPPPPPN